MSEHRRAVVLVTDEGFLFASLAAAREIDACLTSGDAVDVLVYLVDVAAERRARLGALVADTRIRLLGLDSRDYGAASDVERVRSHLPPATLARLVLGPHLPARYEQIVYLDGDVSCTGDVRPLLHHEVRDGRLLAANDSPWLFADDRVGAGRRLRPWLARLGIDDPYDYFNAGVMVVSRSVVDDAFPEALAFFASRPADCPHMDQCALNAVLRGRRDRLSPLYNFHTDYALAGIDRTHAPRLVHFAGGAKPWLVDAPPWHGRFEAGYARLAALAERIDPGLLPRPGVDPAQAAAIAARQRLRMRRIRLATPWRPWLRRRRFGRYLRTADFALR